MTMLTNLEIEAARKAGELVIQPFRPSHLNTVSYNVTLGREVAYYTIAQGVFTHYELGEDEPLYLQPAQRVLARTEETVGGLAFEGGAITTTMHARSTVARLGLQVCGCAGFGDVGYVAPWVLELTNMSPGVMEIPPRAVLAQIAFYRVGEVAPGSAYHQTGSYSIEGEWSLFTHGLPKAFKSALPFDESRWA